MSKLWGLAILSFICSVCVFLHTSYEAYQLEKFYRNCFCGRSLSVEWSIFKKYVLGFAFFLLSIFLGYKSNRAEGVV